MGEATSVARLLKTAGELQTKSAPWAHLLQEQGCASFAASGIPTRRVEAWKYSDLSYALDQKTTETPPSSSIPYIGGTQLIAFDNGRLDTRHSTALPDGVLMALSDVLADPSSPYADILGKVNATEQVGHPIIELNNAWLDQGFVLHLKQGQRLDDPIHLRFHWDDATVAMPTGHHVRILIVLDEGAEATIIETHNGQSAFSSVVTEVRAGERASLTHLRFENLTAASRQSAVTVGDFATEARYRGFYLSEGGLFSRHEALLALSGSDAHIDIDGVALLSGLGHCDNTTVITHAVPNTSSRQAFRTVLAGKAHGAYQGCVKVRPDAQKTDAQQMSRALLLSETAQIATKPELEIFADDVKCSHGATAGELDGDAMFFLRARGIPENEARNLLIEAFLHEAVVTIDIEELRTIAEGTIRDWLSTHASELSHDQ
ncbi:Fe-S cluster assembly protein SufD [Thalassospira sp. MA62]|nr:Fe-S cluster assembly protein SufD [Thalassospira sp. MA62]